MNSSAVKGEMILRYVAVVPDGPSGYKKEIIRHKFEKNDKGAYVFRSLRLPSSGMRLVASPEHRSGIVCFCNEPIPESFTHFVVEAVKSDGHALVVTPVCGDFEDLYPCFLTPDDLVSGTAFEEWAQNNPKSAAEILIRVLGIHGKRVVEDVTTEFAASIKTAQTALNMLMTDLPRDKHAAIVKVAQKLNDACSVFSQVLA